MDFIVNPLIFKYMLAIVVPQPDDRLLGALLFQKSKKFKVYVPEDTPVTADYEGRLNMVHGSWKEVEEPLVCILEPGAVPGPRFVCRVLFCAWLFKKSQVFHVRTGISYGCNASAKKFFKLAVVEHVPAPLSSFVFRSAKLREMSVSRPDGSLEVIPTVIGCAPVRNVWWEKLAWTAPLPPQGPEAVKESVKKNLDLFRWCESFFGDDNFPLSVGDQLDLFATELARLYPDYTEEQLSETMLSFQVSQGMVRKMRASSALSSAIKARERQL